MPRSPALRPMFIRLAAFVTAVPLAACGADRAVTGSTYVHDYRTRHPIMLTDAPTTLDVFVNAANGLDPRQREDVLAFGRDYLRFGKGALTAQMPAGSGAEIAAHRTLAAIRDALETAGMPGGHLAVSTYLVADPRAASAIRLSFTRLQAKVASKCGLWPEDLGTSDARFNTNNASYWNHGCALQSNVAAQIADPVDLVRGRQEGRIDTLRRAKDIENIRQGKDPSTQYRSDEKAKINQQVGQ
jgi:pilus assembly protein CpaD